MCPRVWVCHAVAGPVSGHAAGGGVWDSRRPRHDPAWVGIGIDVAVDVWPRIEVRRRGADSSRGDRRGRPGANTPLASSTPAPGSSHAVAALGRHRMSVGRRAWIERTGVSPRVTPVWLSRDSWLDGLRSWAGSTDFSTVCQQRRVSITAATVVAVATAWAGFADHATGRNAAVTRARLAHLVGCDRRTITRAWTVLGAGGWAREAARGHGSASGHTAGNRASIWHLANPTPARGAVGNVHLPPKAGFTLSSLVHQYSPTVGADQTAPTNDHHRHTQHKKRPPAKRRRQHRRTQPRSLALQRLAAQLVNTCHGLDKPGRTHIGGICDALTTAGINPTTWSAQTLTKALNTDMKTHGLCWPDHITNPAAFLTTRLKRITTHTTTAPISPATHTPKTPHTPIATAPKTPPTPITQTQQQRIITAQTTIRNILNKTSPSEKQRHSQHTSNTANQAETQHIKNPCCCACDPPHAPERKYMPMHRNPICNTS